MTDLKKYKNSSIRFGKIGSTIGKFLNKYIKQCWTTEEQVTERNKSIDEVLAVQIKSLDLLSTQMETIGNYANEAISDSNRLSAKLNKFFEKRIPIGMCKRENGDLDIDGGVVNKELLLHMFLFVIMDDEWFYNVQDQPWVVAYYQNPAGNGLPYKTNGMFTNRPCSLRKSYHGRSDSAKKHRKKMEIKKREARLAGRNIIAPPYDKPLEEDKLYH